MLLGLALWLTAHLRALWFRIDSGRHILPLDFAYYLQVFEGILARFDSGSAIVGSDSIFAVHFSPVVYALSLLYGALREISSAQFAGGALSLLAVLLGTLLIAFRKQGRCETVHPVILTSWLVIVLNSQASLLAMQGPREAVLATPIIALMCLAFAADRPALVFMLAMALLGFREDFLLIVFGFGAHAALQRKLRLAIALFLLATFGGGLALGVHLYAAGNSLTGSVRFLHLGETPLQIALSPLLRPEVFFGFPFRAETGRFALQLLAAFAFLPLLAPRHLLPFAPYFVMLSLNGHEMLLVQSVDAYYAAPFFAPLLLAALEGGRRLVGWLRVFHPQLAIVAPAFVSVYFAATSTFAAIVRPVPAESSLLAQLTEVRKWQRTTGAAALAAPGAFLPYLAELPETTAIERRRIRAQYAVVPANLRRIDLLPDLVSPADYQDWLPQLLRKGKLVMATADVYVIDLGSPASLPQSNPFHSGIEVQAEYCPAERPYDRIHRRSGEREVRVIGARSGFGLLPGPRSAAVICGPFQFARPFAIEVVARRSVAERCSSRRQPPRFALLLENGAVVERSWPETGAEFSSSRLEFPEAAGRPFTILIQSRGCGEYELDFLRLGDTRLAL